MNPYNTNKINILQIKKAERITFGYIKKGENY